MWAGCGPGSPSPYTPEKGSGELQAIIELGEDGGTPFLASECHAAIYSRGTHTDLVIHAGSDLSQDAERLALAMVLDLTDPALPGTIDLSKHGVLLMQLDRAGEAQLVVDEDPQGTAEILGTLEPGHEINGTFGLELHGLDELGIRMSARIDGSFAALIEPAL